MSYKRNLLLLFFCAESGGLYIVQPTLIWFAWDGLGLSPKRRTRTIVLFHKVSTTSSCQTSLRHILSVLTMVGSHYCIIITYKNIFNSPGAQGVFAFSRSRRFCLETSRLFPPEKEMVEKVSDYFLHIIEATDIYYCIFHIYHCM